MKIFNQGRYLTLESLKNGELKISMTNEGKELIEENYQQKTNDQIWSELIDCPSLGGSDVWVNQMIGLTNAPNICIGAIWSESGQLDFDWPLDFESIWYYPDYQIKDELEELLQNGFVIFKNSHTSEKKDVVLF